MTIQRLLAFNQRIEDDLRRIDAAAGPDGPKYRMTEGNSCYRGGKPGMSDAFAASLWAADYMLELASLGCAGVNLHGGKSEFLTAGLGGHTPGRDSAKKPQRVAERLLLAHPDRAGNGGARNAGVLRNEIRRPVCRWDSS